MTQDIQNTARTYAPAAIPGSEDAVFQVPLDRATSTQVANLVRDLLRLSRTRRA